MHALGRLRRRSDTLRIVPPTILLSTLSAFLVSVPARAIASADDGIEIDGVTPSATLIERSTWSGSSPCPLAREDHWRLSHAVESTSTPSISRRIAPH